MIPIINGRIHAEVRLHRRTSASATLALIIIHYSILQDPSGIIMRFQISCSTVKIQGVKRKARSPLCSEKLVLVWLSSMDAAGSSSSQIAC